jgi:tripartite-type tricarboxylate transporter receptor subunit TctC
MSINEIRKSRIAPKNLGRQRRPLRANATKVPRRRFLHLAAGVVATLVPQNARALEYPNRFVRWIVGFPPGSAADTVVRIMSRWLSERLGQQFIVENKPGAATNISVQAAVSAPPDGYTLVYLSSSTAINASLYESLPFNLIRDLAPVSGIVNFPVVMLVRPTFPATTIAQFVAYAKAHPRDIRVASFGTGSISHLAGELFKKMAEIDTIHVPYRASAPAHLDMIAGRVDAMFDNLTSPLPNIRSGALRALAIAGIERYEGLPNIPTIREAIPDYVVSAWAGVAAPRGTPPEIIEKLNQAINAGLSDPRVVAQFAQVATTPLAFTPDEFGAFLGSEVEKWAKVVKFSGAKPE